jgi:hypothetical protein
MIHIVSCMYAHAVDKLAEILQFNASTVSRSGRDRIQNGSNT